MYTGTALATQRCCCVFKAGDDGSAADAGKGHGSFHLGQHAAGCEMTLAAVLLGLGHGHLFQRLLVGFAPVDGNTIHSSQNDQHISADQFCQLGGGKVLVDNGRSADQTTVLGNHGDTTAADGNDNMAALHQRADHILLHNVNGLGAGHNTAIAASGIIYHGKTLFSGDLLSSFFVVEAADGLGGLLESRVVLIHHDLCHNGSNIHFDAASLQLIAVAVGAPLLVGIGVAPIWAVLIPLIGHSWANTFGTLAVAWDALVSSANLTADPVLLLRTALWTGIFIWIWNIILGISICWFYGKMPAVKKGLPAVIIISLIQGGGQLLLGQVNQTLCAFVPCCIALVVSLLLGKTKWYNTPWKIENSKIMDEKFAASASEDYPQDMSLMQAFMPYFVLTGITLFVLLIAPVKAFLGQVSIGFDFPEMRTGYNYIVPAVKRFSSYTPFTHASMFLLLAFPVALIGLSGTIALLYVSLAMILGALVSAPIMSFMAYLKKK